MRLGMRQLAILCVATNCLTICAAFPWRLTLTTVTTDRSHAMRPQQQQSNDNNESLSSRPNLTRRQVNELVLAATGLGITYWGTRSRSPQDYPLWGILPVGPYKRKKTMRETIVPNRLWTLDQKFGILNVQVPVRTTIIKLDHGGGLLVYNSVAATPEMLQLVQELVHEHGPIRHICVASLALEHKVYAGVFAQHFPTAQVWLQPGQYSFPVDLPASWLGFPIGRTQTMPRSIEEAPADWQHEFDLAVLGPIISRDGAFGETVLYHKPTATLLVTDTAVQVTDEVPRIYEDDHAPLLYHARDCITDIVPDTPDTLRKGWRRVVLFGLYFMPSAITIQDAPTALQERRPDINPDFAGVYPWTWDGDEAASWRALTGAGRGNLLVSPILQVLLLNRQPVEVLDFADKVSKWGFTRIIPAHLKNNLRFTGADYRKSFGFLEEQGVPPGFPKPLEADLMTLKDAETSLMKSGAIVEAPPKPGGKFSRQDIIARTMYRCRKDICSPQAEP